MIFGSHSRYMDNIFVERLWRSLKYEEVYLNAYESVAEAKAGMVLSALAPAGGYQSSWGTLLLFRGDEAGCGARHVDQRPSGIGLSARRKLSPVPLR